MTNEKSEYRNEFCSYWDGRATMFLMECEEWNKDVRDVITELERYRYNLKVTTVPDLTNLDVYKSVYEIIYPFIFRMSAHISKNPIYMGGLNYLLKIDINDRFDFDNVFGYVSSILKEFKSLYYDIDITIHYVNELYDDFEKLLNKKEISFDDEMIVAELESLETPDDFAEKMSGAVFNTLIRDASNNNDQCIRSLQVDNQNISKYKLEDLKRLSKHELITLIYSISE